MGNMKFDGADVTFELDGYDALVERVRSKKVNCKINPSDLPRLYAVMDAELEGNEELAAAFAEAQEAAFGEAVLTVWAERIKSFKDSFIPVFGEACKDAACRFGFSKDGNNTFKSAVDAFAANICDLYGAAPQIVDGFCEFLARNAGPGPPRTAVEKRCRPRLGQLPLEHHGDAGGEGGRHGHRHRAERDAVEPMLHAARARRLLLGQAEARVRRPSVRLRELHGPEHEPRHHDPVDRFQTPTPSFPSHPSRRLSRRLRRPGALYAH